MDDTVDLSYSACCMRKNPKPIEQFYDGVHVNVALSGVYIATFLGGYKVLCLSSFIYIFLNTLHMWSIYDKAFPPPGQSDTDDSSLDDSMDSSDDANAAKAVEQKDSDDTVAIDDSSDSSELSLKQREHGARRSKVLTEDDDALLNKQFKELVEECKKRNLTKQTEPFCRTPTGTSLNELDEYADMPPLIPLGSQNPATSIYDYDVFSSLHSEINNPIYHSVYDDLAHYEQRIPSFQEILNNSRNQMRMDEVD